MGSRSGEDWEKRYREMRILGARTYGDEWERAVAAASSILRTNNDQNALWHMEPSTDRGTRYCRPIVLTHEQMVVPARYVCDAEARIAELEAQLAHLSEHGFVRAALAEKIKALADDVAKHMRRSQLRLVPDTDAAPTPEETGG